MTIEDSAALLDHQALGGNLPATAGGSDPAAVARENIPPGLRTEVNFSGVSGVKNIGRRKSPAAGKSSVFLKLTKAVGAV
jgi:hypothetical protein